MKRLASHALVNWPIDTVSIELIKYRENGVFRVDTADGKKFVLRIHRPGYHSDAAIASELEWMAALAQSGLDVPQVVPAKNGDLFVKAIYEEIPETRLIDLLEWVDGETLRDRIEREKQLSNHKTISSLFGQAGELMARLHNHAAVWKAPAGLERHAWDADGLVGDRPFWGRFWEFDLLTTMQKKQMIEIRDQLRNDFANFPKSAATYGLIHADFNLDNLMANGDHVQIIDFDDAGFGWHLFDIATMLTRIEEEPFEKAARDAFFAGYRHHRPLPEEHLKYLPMFVTARQLTYLGWAQDRQEIEEIRERADLLINAAVRTTEEYLSNSGL